MIEHEAEQGARSKKKKQKKDKTSFTAIFLKRECIICNETFVTRYGLKC